RRRNPADGLLPRASRVVDPMMIETRPSGGGGLPASPCARPGLRRPAPVRGGSAPGVLIESTTQDTGPPVPPRAGPAPVNAVRARPGGGVPSGEEGGRGGRARAAAEGAAPGPASLRPAGDEVRAVPEGQDGGEEVVLLAEGPGVAVLGAGGEQVEEDGEVAEVVV